MKHSHPFEDLGTFGVDIAGKVMQLCLGVVVCEEGAGFGRAVDFCWLADASSKNVRNMRCTRTNRQDAAGCPTRHTRGLVIATVSPVRVGLPCGVKGRAQPTARNTSTAR